MVRQIELPASARALSSLRRVDYADAFVVEIDEVREHTAEEWLRRLMEGAPESVQRSLRSGWTTLGLRLGPEESREHIVGWAIRRSTPDFVLLGGNSRLGFEAELLLRREDDRTLLFSTLVHKRNVIGRAIWLAIEAGHQRVVRHVLGRAAARNRTTGPRQAANVALG